MGRIKQYDAIIIGGGAAGMSAAQTINNAGFNVCIIESNRLGGECPSEACIPTKALLNSAKKYYSAKKHLVEFGVFTSKVSFRFSEIMHNKKDIINAITGNGQRFALQMKNVGIDVIYGEARFLNENIIDVDGRKLQGKAFVIATGTSSFIPPISGLRESGFLTFKEAITLNVQPKSLLIIGAGPVGSEFATFFGMLGTKVTVLQLDDRILQREDSQISDLAKERLESFGVNIFTNTKTLSVQKEGRKYRVWYQIGEGKRKSILVEKVLVAAGKHPMLSNLGLDEAEIKVDERGHIIVKDTMQTSQKHIFAAGDIVNKLQFTHTANASGAVAGENIVKILSKKRGKSSKYDNTIVPRVTFLSPEVASVGLTLEDAKNKGIDALEKESQLARLPRSIVEGNSFGKMKLVVDSKTRKIIGGHMIGERAGEVIHEVALAMYADITVDELAGRIRAFPTYSEIISATAKMF